MSKEHPILFNGAMVRALLDGSKTQTRRAVSARHLSQIDLGRTPCKANWSKPMPYGQPGDRLWVRETFFAWGRWETRFSAKKGRDEWHFVDMTLECGHNYIFDADKPKNALRNPGLRSEITPNWWKRPAIFMPRWASRNDLEITGVRVETLGIISHEDALAEGVSSIEEYKALWININGAWLPETWVWVVDFRMVLN